MRSKIFESGGSLRSAFPELKAPSPTDDYDTFARLEDTLSGPMEAIQAGPAKRGNGFNRS